MIKNFKIVKVNSTYCDYLRKYDNRVCYNAGIKELRPFIGVLFIVEKCEYFAPLSSPKDKHLKMKNNIDLIKIDNGKLGVININNMIPVTSKNYELIDLNKTPLNINEFKRQNLLKSQLLWLNKNSKNIKFKSNLLYMKYKYDKLPLKFKERCCDFLLLEEKCKDYNNYNN